MFRKLILYTAKGALWLVTYLLCFTVAYGIALSLEPLMRLMAAWYNFEA